MFTIDFTIDANKKTYKIIWTESEINKLYFLAEPIKPVKIVQDEKLVLDFNYKEYRQKFDILKSLSDSAVALPSKVQQSYTTYRFELYDNPCYEGVPLRECSAYLGPKRKLINMKRRPYRDGMIQLFVECSIQVPEDMFWLEFSDLHEHIPFYLPPMEKENNIYKTSCLLSLEACKKWELFLDEQIMDYMEIAKEE